MAQQAQNEEKEQKKEYPTLGKQLGTLLELQSMRAKACNNLEQEFRKVINFEISDESFAAIAQNCNKEMNQASIKMNQLKDDFREQNILKHVKTIETLQSLEKERITIICNMQATIFAARPNANDMEARNGIWRPRLDKEKQQLAQVIEKINDLLAEVTEIKRNLTMAQRIYIKGNRIIYEPILDDNEPNSEQKSGDSK